jgi:imidazole glycerol-phosphate synthase subunit HisH
LGKVAVVDSGCANLSSIYKALMHLHIDAFITDEASAVAAADGIIFPGVGSFAHTASLLRQNGLEEALLASIAAGKPFLGICLGLQLLFTRSEERGGGEGPLPAGLGAIPGQVRRFSPGLPVPHVGWNRIIPRARHPLFNGLPEDAYFYFTHSYYVQPDNPAHTLALTEYGQLFTAAAARKNLIGVQFHPEKSGPVGLHLLSNFGKIIADPGLL